MEEFSTVGLPEWQLKLINKYPDIYLEPNPEILEWYKTFSKPLTKDKIATFCNLRYGFEFGEGWSALVDEFSSKINAFVCELKSTGAQADAYVRSYIFKQKMGRLTWQGSDNLKTVYKPFLRSFISACEQESTVISEKSGHRGKLREINGYLFTCSDEEYEQIISKKKNI